MNHRMNLLYLTVSLGVCVMVCTAADTHVKPINFVTLPQAHKGTLDIDTLLLPLSPILELLKQPNRPDFP